MIRRFKIGYEVELHKRTVERGLLSLIGPSATRIAGAEETAGRRARERRGRDRRHRGARRAHRHRRRPALRRRRHRAPEPRRCARAAPRRSQRQAAEFLRVEHGRPRYGIDLDETTIPQEAGLNERAVSFTKGCYVGQETVARLHYKGKPNRHLRGLRLSEPVAAGRGAAAGRALVGRL